MTNKTAIAFGLFVIAAITYDVMINDNANVVFLLKQGMRLIGWIAFWR